MLRTRERLWLLPLAGLFALALAAASSAADKPAEPKAAADKPAGPKAASPSSPAKHTLRYKFRAGDVLRWEVVHETRIETTVSGTSQMTDAKTTSTKVWKITGVQPDGNATFEYSVSDVDMRQKLTGRMEVHYNSRTDKSPPHGFEGVAKMIGVPLANITLDSRGNVQKRENLQSRPQSESGPVTVLLPEQPIAIGENWTLPYDVEASLPGGGIRKVKTRQSFTLQDVKDGIATIRMETQILSPIDDPMIEAQLIQRETAGTIRFDLAAGRIVGQATEVDRRVIGFRGPASSIHCRTLFTEKSLVQEAKSAPVAAAGKASEKK